MIKVIINKKFMKKLIILMLITAVISGCNTAKTPVEKPADEPTTESQETTSTTEPTAQEKEVQKPVTKTKKTTPTASVESQKEPEAPATKSKWTLTAGTEPYPDISGPLVYEGAVELQGWVVDVPFYVGDPEPHFRVSDASLASLPPREKFLSGERRDFRLIKIAPERVEELRKYASRNPATIIATKIIVNSEGTAIIEFK